MDVHINTRHCELTDLEHQAAVDAATHLQRFHSHIIRVDITAILDAGIVYSEFSVHVPGHTVVTKEEGPDHTKAIHDAREKIERQLRKISDRMNDVRSTLT